MEYTIITNNPVVKDRLSNVLYCEVSPKELLIKIRNVIHKKYFLISHPLGASKKMMSSPFRSIIISNKRQKDIDQKSLEVVESSILKLNNHLKINKLDYNNYTDYQKLDYKLLESALKESKHR